MLIISEFIKLKHLHLFSTLFHTGRGPLKVVHWAIKRQIFNRGRPEGPLIIKTPRSTDGHEEQAAAQVDGMNVEK